MSRWLLAVSALLAAPLAAQNAPQRPTCDAPEFRQFDFWVGDWVVENPQNGQLQGTNNITLDLNRCVITEHWTGSQGGHGTSFNIYDRRRGVWHQTWVDDGGVLLVLEGHFAGGRMVLQSAPVPARNGGMVINRITWTPQEGGRVEQHWEVSRDDGATWQTAFLGVYRPRT